MTTIQAIDSRTVHLFHAVPRRVYEGRYSGWTPVMPAAEAALFDPARNSALGRTELARWCALRDGAPVGRVAAFAPRDLPGIGYFGFFETVDDADLARALLGAAEAWLAQRVRRRIFGPIAVNPRDQIGLLVEGFEEPGGVLTPYNPPYYAPFLEASGYRPTIGLRAYSWRPDMLDIRGMVALGEQIATRGDIAIRPIDLRRLEAEALLIAKVLNESFQDVWGYVPVTDAEALDLARDLRPIVDPRLCLVAMRQGEPCGVAVTVPDANWLIRQIGGRLLPFGWLKALWLRRRIPTARFMALGVLPGGRAMGTAVQLMLATHRGLVAGGYRSAELSQVFDDNQLMRRLLERMGCPVVKRYAVFERSLPGGGAA